MKFILETIDLSMEFKRPRKMFGPAPKPVKAVEGVDLSVRKGEVLGIVGESGSGKSTLAKTILGLYAPSRGSIILEGNQSHWTSRRQARRERHAIQYVHQDPGAALDPWWSIGRTLHEALLINGEKDARQRERLIGTMMEAVGLSSEYCKRYPHELSGGQQRRIGIARTLILKPSIVILDEPTSGLDMSVQKTVLTLVHGIRKEFDLTYLFVSHDLSVVRHLCDRTAIMKDGCIVEIGDTASIFADPQHEYTRTLIAAAPSLHSERLALPSSINIKEHP